MASRISRKFPYKCAMGCVKSFTGVRSATQVGRSILLGRNSYYGKSYHPFNYKYFHASAALKATHQINMPSLSPTMTEGTIVKWLKKPGDKITAGDVLCEIQTDKAVIALESEEDGILAKILMPDDSLDVKVGTLIALTVDENDDWQSAEVASSGSSSSGAAPPPPPPIASSGGGDKAGGAEVVDVPVAEGVHKVNMPSLSPTMTEGTIIQWLKSEGDKIAAGDTLCEIQTDKAVIGMEWEEDGILAKILVPAGTSDVKVGSLIALMVEDGIEWKNVKVPTTVQIVTVSSSSSPPKSAASAATPLASQQPSSGHGHGSDIKGLGPAVKNHLKQYGLQPNQVAGTGRHGKATKGDVLKYVQSNNIQPVSQGAEPIKTSTPAAGKPAASKTRPGKPASFVDIEVTTMRRTIAKRLLESKSTVPHSYGTAECDVKNLGLLRKKLAAEGIKVSVNDIIIKCVGNALQRVPKVNCVWDGEKLMQHGSVDISVAVATPNGLITPIVFNVGDKDIIEIGENVKDLAAKARDGKLKPHEFIGGSFTISNLGMFGIHTFSAIINPPQVGIVAVGANIISVDEDCKPRTTCKLVLSYDRRAVDEEESSKFLAALRFEIETVNEMTTGIYNVEAKKEAFGVVKPSAK
jgi:pyruvate dehydrogenase complex dihydrolipoamide acetyltransferase long form